MAEWQYAGGFLQCSVVVVVLCTVGAKLLRMLQCGMKVRWGEGNYHLCRMCAIDLSHIGQFDVERPQQRLVLAIGVEAIGHWLMMVING